MADRGDTHYFTPTLNRWFAFSSVFFLFTVAWMVIDDWNAEWKGYQREFRELELAKAEEALARMESAGVIADRESLQAKVEEAQVALDQNRGELETGEKELLDKTELHYKLEQGAKALKGEYGMVRYAYDELVFKKGDPDAIESRRVELEELENSIQEAEYATAQALVERDAVEARLTDMRAGVAEAEATIAASTTDLARVEQKIEQLDPSAGAVRLANFVRDFPGLDFVGPNLKIQKHVLSNLTFELNFTKKIRIDMCTTCHMGMDTEGWEDAEQPFATHPRLDLFLTSKSPHPVKDVGCSICHRGAGEALSFQTADHRPANEEQAEEWHHDLHWHKQHHWDYPMLKSQHVEASCVQCHKTTMDLIADDAPAVTEGYRLFERYGCYACHKVDWFPTERRPGPSLKNLAAKLRPEWVDAWVEDPKSFRPTTWMPQIFHLENFPPQEVIVPAPAWGTEEEPIYGQSWSDSAVASVTAFLFANHPKQDLGPIPVEESDSERGRELFNLVGCTGCHNTAAYPGEELLVSNLSDEATRYNTKGPNLRGVASKIDRNWLFHWIKDPESIWSETNMPDLRLPDQDAADITAYLMDDPDGIFHDVPEDWVEGGSPVDLRTLQEQARWFFQKLGRTEIQRRLDGENPEHRWDEAETLKVVVGEAWITNQGCFSCHEIGGMEKGMPIGTELSNWSSKTVDKLDFGIAYRKELAGMRKLDHDYREEFLERKLHRPRSYDLEKVKNPKEKLRMPQFGFTDEQVDSLMTFVLGLVDDEVQLAKMEPSEKDLAKDVGLRMLRQKNCLTCHLVEPGRVTYEHESGQIITLEGELLPLPDEKLPPKMESLESLRTQLADWAEYMEEDVPEEVGVRLLTSHGDVGVAGENIFLPLQDVRSIRAPFGGDFVRLVTDYYFNGVWIANPDYEPSDPESYPDMPWTIEYDEDTEQDRIEDVDGKTRFYAGEEYDKVRWTFAPPVLTNEGHKVQPGWFYSFLQDPVPLRSQIRVRMPSFHYGPGEAEAIAQAFAVMAEEDWYGRYSNNLRLTLGRERRPAVADDAEHGWPAEAFHTWPTSVITTERGPGLSLQELSQSTGISAANLAAIEEGKKIAIGANFNKLNAWGTDQGFSMVGPPSTSFEAIQRRQPSYQPQVDLGATIAKDAVNCFQCHFLEGNPPDQIDAPLAWAPDLANARERLREDWVWEWLWSPKVIYPGTAMPENFAPDVPMYEEVAPNTTNAEQVGAVLDWLFNLDKHDPTSF